MDAITLRQQQAYHPTTNPFLTVQSAQPHAQGGAQQPMQADMAGTPNQTSPAYSGNSQQGPLGQWNPWATSGGTNPNAWQSLGGPQNTGFLNMGNWTQGGADPTHVAPTQDVMTATQPYTDAAYQQSTRQLDPQWQQQQAAFDQQMVNKGIAPGSAAYDQAKTAFDHSRNDAYAGARNQALAQGLMAQQQAFGQGLSQSQLANQLAGNLIGANTSYANQQLGGNASIMNQLLGGNSAITQQLIGADASRFNANVNAGASNYAAGLSHDLGMANLNQNGQQMDFNNLMQLLNMGQGVNQYNNGLTLQDQQRQQSMWGFMPNGNAGNGNIDVQNPYNNQYNGQMNSWNYQNQQANAQNQNYAQWASILASMYGGGG